MEKKRLTLNAGYGSEDHFIKCRELGFTLFQTDSKHLSINDRPDGSWDWGVFDEQCAHTLDEACERVTAEGLQWMLFPHFAFPAPWYRESVEFTRIRCLEHDDTIEAFSLFEPKALDYLERGYRALAEHFGEKISAFYLGVHGDYGECMYPAACRMNPGQRDDWERRLGNLHNHYGYWCGDALAREDFRKTVLARHGGLAAVNRAWSAAYTDESEITYPPIPPQWQEQNVRGLPDSVSSVHWLDFTRWYLDSMTAYSRAVACAANRHFPGVLKMFPLGSGDEDVRVGQDNSGLVKMASEEGVAVRSTHGGCNEFSDNAVTMLTRISSACKFYGVGFSSEPPGSTSSERMVSRVFESICSGAAGIFDWQSNPSKPDNGEVYRKYRDILVVDKPVVRVALFYPQTWHYLHPEESYPARFRKMGGKIRSLAHFDIIDERMVADGAAEQYDFIVHLQGDVVERTTVRSLIAWVEKGGVLCSFMLDVLKYTDGGTFDLRCLLPSSDKPAPIRVGRGAVCAVRGGEDEIEEKELEYYRLLGDVFYDAPITGTRGSTPLDGVYRTTAGVYGVVLESGRRLVYNSTSNEVTVTLGGGCVLPPHSITEVG